MTFRDEMRMRCTGARTSEENGKDFDRDAHNYAEADRILSLLKDRIRAQVDHRTRRAEGQTTLGSRTSPEGFRQVNDLVVMEEQNRDLGFFRSCKSAHLTKKGCVILRDLEELAESEGISLDMALCYQGALYPIEKEEMTSAQSHWLLHRHRLTQSSPSIQIRYSFQVA